jgi:hypothetical protein
MPNNTGEEGFNPVGRGTIQCLRSGVSCPSRAHRVQTVVIAWLPGHNQPHPLRIDRQRGLARFRSVFICQHGIGRIREHANEIRVIIVRRLCIELKP